MVSLHKSNTRKIHFQKINKYKNHPSWRIFILRKRSKVVGIVERAPAGLLAKLTPAGLWKVWKYAKTQFK